VTGRVADRHGQTPRDRLTEAGLTPQFYGEVITAARLITAYSIVLRLLQWTRRSDLLINLRFTRVGLSRTLYWINDPHASIWCAVFTT
jgi:hypothetical protein